MVIVCSSCVSIIQSVKVSWFTFPKSTDNLWHKYLWNSPIVSWVGQFIVLLLIFYKCKEIMRKETKCILLYVYNYLLKFFIYYILKIIREYVKNRLVKLPFLSRFRQIFLKFISKKDEGSPRSTRPDLQIAVVIWKNF